MKFYLQYFQFQRFYSFFFFGNFEFKFRVLNPKLVMEDIIGMKREDLFKLEALKIAGW